MPEFLIVPHGVRGYAVEIRWPGGFRSVSGFATEVEAQAWIVAERRRDPTGSDPAGTGA